MSDNTSTGRRVSFNNNGLTGQRTVNNNTGSSNQLNTNTTKRFSKVNSGADSARRGTQNFEIPTLFNSQSCLNIIANETEEECPYLNPEEYFRKVLDPKLLCYKCKLLYTNPISCYKCEKVYCSECLEWELNSHSRCLYCFNIVFKDIAQRVNGDINEEYEKHEVKCPYKKCKEVKKLKNIREHIADCLYRDDQNDKNKLEHIEKVVCFDNENDIYVQNHLMNYFKKQYEEYQKELLKNNNIAQGTITNRTNRTIKTMKTIKTMNSISGSKYSRFSNKSKLSPSKKRESLFNYQSFLDDNEFTPKSEELKKILEVTNEYIGKTVFELASKTKETNEKLKNMVNK